MLHVVIDTNALEAVPTLSQSSKFNALRELCERGEVQLHIPTIVQQEFLGHREGHINKGLREMREGLKRIKHQAFADHSCLLAFCAEFEEVLSRAKVEFPDNIADEFLQWGQTFNAQFHPVAPGHGDRVVRAYFNAELPFKAPEMIPKGKRDRFTRRKDEFPDAFIWQTVLDLVETHQRIHFITNNTSDFQKLCAETSGVVLHRTLDNFLECEALKRFRVERFTDQHAEAILQALQQQEDVFKPKFIHAIAEEVHCGWYLENLKSDPEIEISGAFWSAEHEWLAEIDYEQTRTFGYGIITIPVTVTIERFNMSYYKTIYELPHPLPSETRILSTLEPGDPATLIVDDFFPLTLDATVDLQFPAEVSGSLTLENLPEMLDHLEITVEQIDEMSVGEGERRQEYTIA